MAAVAFSLDDGSRADDGAQQPPDRLLVNKRELAKQILKCSLPTLNDLIDRYPDFPVDREGSNGVEWQFDAAKVIGFLEEKRQAEVKDAAERAALFGQLVLPIDSIAGDDAAISPAQRLAAARARIAERQLALETGMLVQASELRQVLQGSLARLGRFLENLPAEIERRFNLPAEVSFSMRERIDEARAEFVASVKPYLTE